MGDGEGAVYGQLTDNGAWPDGDPGAYDYALFDPSSASVSSGGAGGGAGGDGQLLPSGNGINVSATEGTAFSGNVADFTDPAPPNPASYSATIDWGDGTQTTASTDDGSIASDGMGGWNVKGTHTYTEEGSYTITIVATPTGDPNSALTMTSTATVVDAYIFATGQNEGATVGVPFNGVVATISDSNPFATAADFSASIYWPDNSTNSAGTVSGPTGGPFTVSGLHTFATAGSWQVRVSVQDDGGAGASAVSVFTVSGGYGGGGSMMATDLSPASAPMTAPADSAVVFASLPIAVTPSGVALLLPVVPPDATDLPLAPADSAAPSGTPPAAALPGDGAVSDAMALALASVRDTSSGLPDGLDAGGNLLADLGAPLLPADGGLA